MRIEQKKYVMEIDKQSGAIQSWSNGKKSFVRPSNLPLFLIRFRDAAGECIEIGAKEARQIDLKRIRTEAEERITIMYEGVGGYEIQVQVTVRCPHDESLTYWSLTVEHDTDWLVEWIDFPAIVVPNDLTSNGGTGKLLWPGNEGVIVEDTKIRDSNGFKYIEPEYPSRGTAGIYPAAVPTQFMAYYEELGGFYMGAHDEHSHVKCIEYFPVEEGIRLQFRLYPGGVARGSFGMDYEMALGVFEGDWHDAADLYRNWYQSASRHKSVRILDNEKLPDWYADSPVVITYPVRGTKDTGNMEANRLFPYAQAIPHLEKLADEFQSRILVLLMHWEGTAPWAPPYVWPPFGGEEDFRSFADLLHQSGHLLGVYCSGIGWTEQSRLIPEYIRKEQFDREGLEEAMCVSPTGELPYSNICTGQRRGYDLCPAHEFTNRVVIDEVERMIEGGCDYIQYFDQNHGGTSYFCYSHTHGHPPAPGKWQIDAMKRLFGEMQQVADRAGKKVLFGCESVSAEPYISDLLFNDARFNLNYFIGTPVPLYAYLYHEYINNFMGNQNPTQMVFDFERSPDNLLYRLAYAFNAGDMTTVVIRDDGQITWSWGADWSIPLPNQDHITAFIRESNAWRTGAAKSFLYCGKMLKPFPVMFAPEQQLRMLDGRELVVPYVLTSRWQSADGRLGQMVINYSPDPVSCDIVFHEFAGQTILRVEDPSGNTQNPVAVDEKGLLNCRLEPLSAVLFLLP
jgi:hypothetical protein